METGFHLIQGDGSTTRDYGENLIDTVADGLYHAGFNILWGRFLNEDGNANATVEFSGLLADRHAEGRSRQRQPRQCHCATPMLAAPPERASIP